MKGILGVRRKKTEEHFSNIYNLIFLKSESTMKKIEFMD